MAKAQRQRRQTIPKYHLYPRQVAREHTLIDPLVPYEGRSYDPLTVLQAIHRTIDATPPTAATITATNVYRRLDISKEKVNHHLPTFMRVLGCRRVHISEKNDRHYVNPEYVHKRGFRPVKDERARIRMARHYAVLGTADLSFLADAWGVQHRSVRQLLQRYGVPWRRWDRQGRRRMARTTTVLREWTDTPRKTVAKAVGVEPGTLEDWESQLVTEAVPKDPTVEDDE